MGKVIAAKDLNFEKRYAQNWTTDFRRGIHQSVGGVCIHCKKEKSKEIHHAHYKDRRGAIAGREKPGVDLFPLCQKCHGIAHSKGNWIKDKTDPVLGNRNADKFLNQLEDNWKAMAKGKTKPDAKAKKWHWWKFAIWAACGVLGWLVMGVVGFWLGVVLGGIVTW